jgi:hypothetical protein
MSYLLVFNYVVGLVTCTVVGQLLTQRAHSSSLISLIVTPSVFNNHICRYSRINSTKFPASLISLVVTPSVFNNHICRYSRINSTKFPASAAGNISEPRLVSEDGRMREVVCA